MGEMLLESLRGDLPVVVLRPSVVESTLAEPFPGWLEGIRYVVISLGVTNFVHLAQILYSTHA